MEHVDNSIKNFDSLPDSAFVRISTVKALLTCSSSTAWRLVKNGSLIPHKLTPRTTAFQVRDVRKLLSESR